jgi:hypothetical protein
VEHNQRHWIDPWPPVPTTNTSKTERTSTEQKTEPSTESKTTEPKTAEFQATDLPETLDDGTMDACGSDDDDAFNIVDRHEAGGCFSGA